MISVISATLNGTLGQSGTAPYVITIRNSSDATIEIVSNNTKLTLASANPACPIQESQIKVTGITVVGPQTGSDQVPPGEEASIVATIETIKAPVNCMYPGVKAFTPMLIVPTLTVKYKYVAEPPDFTAKTARFALTQYLEDGK